MRRNLDRRPVTKQIETKKFLFGFVIVARRARLLWTATEVQKRLVEQGVDEEQAEELGQIYGHCRAALQLAGKGDHRDEVWSLFLS
jgi:hypothetical protein